MDDIMVRNGSMVYRLFMMAGLEDRLCDVKESLNDG